jgi:glutaminase
MAVNALAKVVELSLKLNHTPFQELLKLVGVIPNKDNFNDLNFHKKENLCEK